MVEVGCCEYQRGCIVVFGDAGEDEIIEKVIHIIKQHFSDDVPTD